MGGLNSIDLVAQDGSNAVAIIGDVEDRAAIVAAPASPLLSWVQPWRRHGVVPPLTIYIKNTIYIKK